MAKTPNYNWTTYEDGTTVINFQDDISGFIHDVDNILSSHMADYASLLEGGQIFDVVFENGWSGNVKVSRNALGDVWLRGIGINVGTLTSGTTIATLPTQFRPLNSEGFIPIPIYTASGGAMVIMGLVLQGDGQIRVREPAVTELSGRGSGHINIRYKVS